MKMLWGFVIYLNFLKFLLSLIMFIFNITFLIFYKDNYLEYDYFGIPLSIDSLIYILLCLLLFIEFICNCCFHEKINVKLMEFILLFFKIITTIWLSYIFFIRINTIWYLNKLIITIIMLNMCYGYLLFIYSVLLFILIIYERS